MTITQQTDRLVEKLHDVLKDSNEVSKILALDVVLHTQLTFFVEDQGNPEGPRMAVRLLMAALDAVGEGFSELERQGTEIVQ